MTKTTKKQRAADARSLYQMLNSGCSQKAALVVRRQDSKSNPNIHRCQFITARINGPASDVVIAESVDGITGCFYELVHNIHGDIPQKGYFEDGFKEWLRKTCHLNIVWDDGLVIMIEYKN